MMLKCLEVLLIGVTYIAVSAGLISFNKYLMKEHRFPHAVHLTAVHMATTMLLSTLLFTAAPSIYPSMAKAKGSAGAGSAGTKLGSIARRVRWSKRENSRGEYMRQSLDMRQKGLNIP